MLSRGPSAVPLLSMSVIFFMLRPPTRSTLFPYTTLFRSPQGADQPIWRIKADDREDARGCVGGLPVQLWRAALFQRRRRRSAGDRKSTRLNSSHSSISYAVFCLKKKTQPLYCLGQG